MTLFLTQGYANITEKGGYVANSMDMILVKFGTSLSRKEHLIVKYPLTAEEKDKAEEWKSKIKTITTPEFLTLNSEELTEKERAIQIALQKIYKINNGEYPLYREFPTFRSKTDPLVIDTTVMETDKVSYSFFDVLNNEITFTDIKDPNFLVQILAHELKHAEQADEEVFQCHNRSLNGISMENAYAWHQLEFLKEAQAYTTESRAHYEIFGITDNGGLLVKIYGEMFQKHTGISDRVKETEIEMINFLLNCLYDGETFPYKNRYDMHAPVGENDTGLDHIPEVFHLPQDLLSKLKEAPRRAHSLLGKLLQAMKNKHMDEYMRLLHDGIDKNEKIPLGYIDYLLENGSPEQIREALLLKKRVLDSSDFFDKKD